MLFGKALKIRKRCISIIKRRIYDPAKQISSILSSYFFVNIYLRLNIVNYFHKETPSYMLGWVLNSRLCYEKGFLEKSCQLFSQTRCIIDVWQGSKCITSLVKWLTLQSRNLRISSVNVVKFAGNCGFGHIYWRSL